MHIAIVCSHEEEKQMRRWLDNTPQYFHGTEGLHLYDWDVLVVTMEGGGLLRQGDGVSCNTLLLWEGWHGNVPQIQWKTLIPFGMSSGSTITFSSIHDRGEVLCIQREIRCPNGLTIEPQELPLPYDSLPCELLLAVLGLQLLIE